MDNHEFPPVQLPVIDLSPFLNSASPLNAKSGVAAQLHDACRTYGAFYLIGHGIDTTAVMSGMRSFFDLSSSQKKSISIKPGGFTRGYIGMGEESGSELLEVKEAFSYGYPWPPERVPDISMEGSNVWPDKAWMTTEGQAGMENFYESLCGVAEGLTRAFSLSYGKGEEYLLNHCNGGETISLIRLFHYFPYKAADELFPEHTKRIGSSPHTDWGFLTLIVQEDNVPGLQLHHQEEWKDVLPEPGALLVNCGDYFSLLTGGEYISPLHRVVSSGRERMSAVLFYYPSYDAKMPLLGGQDYSLFKDQREFVDLPIIHTIPKNSFGEFIEEKWLQVQRKNS